MELDVLVGKKINLLMSRNSKAKLRKQEPVALGKQYAGSRVSRDALEADSDDDPFAAPTDDDQNSDEGPDNEGSDDSGLEDESVVESDLNGLHSEYDSAVDDEMSDEGARENTKTRSDSSLRQQKQSKLNTREMPSRTQRQGKGSKLSQESLDEMDMTDSSTGSYSGSEASSDEGDSGMGDNMLMTDEDDSEAEDDLGCGEEDEESEEEDEEDDETNAKDNRHANRAHKQDDREELRRLMASDQKTIAATISQAAKADAAKGKAVKEQRTTFDALLNTRIKLQKGLSAINEMSDIVGGADNHATDSGEAEEDSETIKSAESAALALWSTLEELRTALSDAHSKEGAKKRKRISTVTPTTSTSSLWERMADLESESLPHRRSVLDKWSSKVRGTSTSRPNVGGKLLGSASGLQSVTTVLDAQVATELGDRSSKRARQNATANGSDSTAQSQVVYDDTAFYQSLLRELVEQRMSSEAISGGLDSLQQLPSRLLIHPITGMRNDKVKRDVDTRASKGRKMRFNVHEKLQNFMAPEDRGTWTVRARDEFFASLLGKTASGLLGEGDESDGDVESDDDREEGGLRLFRG